MTEEANTHPDPAHKTPTPAHDDGPPDGYEADWFKWSSRLNRRHHFQRQHAPCAKRSPSSEDDKRE